MNSEQSKVIAKAYEDIVEAHGRLQGLASNVANKAEYDFLTALADHLVITYDEAFEDREIAPNPTRSDLVDDLSAARMDIHQITELDRAYENLLGARLEVEKLNLDDPDEAEFVKYLRGELESDTLCVVQTVTAELGANNHGQPDKVIYDYNLKSLEDDLTSFSKIIRDVDERARAALADDDEYGDDEANHTTDNLQGNEAVMARLLVDDDNENDPVPYQDEATADHKFAHPNYGGTESPVYEFFDVFRTAGQKEGVYSIDVPLTQEVREAVEHEPENSLPGDPNQNYCRLEITIDRDGHSDVVLDGSEGDGLEEYLFDVYNMSIRAGVERYAREHGLIADRSLDDENDPVAYHHDREPMTADWGEIPERAVSDDGRLLREVGGNTIATVIVPDDLAKKFDVDTLDELGVHFDDQNRVELQVKTVDGEVRLDPHFVRDSYQDRFEAELFDHHRDALQAEADRMAAAVAEAKAAMTSNIKVAGASDFADSNPTERSLLVRIGSEEIVVTAPIDESGNISKVEVDPDQIGYDPATDNGARYQQLSALLEEVREPILQAVREYHANADQHILHDTGWTDSRTFEHGYCVIPGDEIDRLGADPDMAGGHLVAGDLRTAEGYPIRATFDIDGNLESAVIPGTKTSLKPVLEGSRDHFVEAKAQLADSGIVLSKAESGDYRVDYHSSSSNHRAGEYGSAQFSDTVSGATEIGHKMAAESAQQVTTRFQNDAERFERQAA
jgi:hypothetical protein